MHIYCTVCTLELLGVDGGRIRIGPSKVIEEILYLIEIIAPLT
jgi:hypothetical protein